MRVLFPSMSPDGLKVKPKPLPAGRGQTRLQPFEHAHLQPIPSWFHFNCDKVDPFWNTRTPRKSRVSLDERETRAWPSGP